MRRNKHTFPYSSHHKKKKKKITENCITCTNASVTTSTMKSFFPRKKQILIKNDISFIVWICHCTVLNQKNCKKPEHASEQNKLCSQQGVALFCLIPIKKHIYKRQSWNWKNSDCIVSFQKLGQLVDSLHVSTLSSARANS